MNIPIDRDGMIHEDEHIVMAGFPVDALHLSRRLHTTATGVMHFAVNMCTMAETFLGDLVEKYHPTQRHNQ